MKHITSKEYIVEILKEVNKILYIDTSEVKLAKEIINNLIKEIEEWIDCEYLKEAQDGRTN